MNSNVVHFDSGKILTHEFTPEGFLRIHMRVSRAGDLSYRNDDGTQRIETVSRETLFSKASYDSLKMKPLTLQHPPVLLSADNARDYQRGMTGHHVTFDGDFLGIVATVTDRETIDSIKNGVREVSCGYTCDIVPRSDGRFDQLNRHYNHVAIVNKGRAGEHVRVNFDACECWSEDPGDCDCTDKETTPTKKKKMDTQDLMQIEIMGKPFRVDAETYTAIRAEQTLAADLKKRVDMMEKGKEEALEADEDESIPEESHKATKRKDAKKADPKPTPEMEEDDEEMEEGDEMKMDSLVAAMRSRLDALEGENMGLRDRLEMLRIDAKSMPGMEDEEAEEDEYEEAEMPTKKMDTAEFLQTWEVARTRLLPEINAQRLTFDSLEDPIAIKREFLRVTVRDTSRLDEEGNDVYIDARFDAMMDAPPPMTAKEQLDRAAASVTRADGMGCEAPPKQRKMKKLTYGGAE